MRQRSPWVIVMLALALSAPMAGEGIQPSAGTFLVAQRHLGDPNFERTVVLLVDHDRTGAFGLVVNRRTEVSLGDLMPDVAAAADRTVFVGGPVKRTSLHFLIQSDTPPGDARVVFDDVHYGRSRALLAELLGPESPVRRFRVYSGYSGWSAGQLDAEIARGDWLVVPADPAVVFWTDPERLWQRLSPADPREWARL